MHRFRHGWCIAAFELKTPALTASNQKKIEFGTTLRAPEIGVVLPVDGQDLFKRETFPRGAIAWMRSKSIHIADSKE